MELFIGFWLVIFIVGVICWIVKTIAEDNTTTNSEQRKRLDEPLITQQNKSNSAYTFLDNAHKFEIFDDKLTETTITEILKLAGSGNKYSLKETGNNGHKYTYTLESVHIHEERRTVKVLFERQEEYRTIVRYEQRNYVKYPVYSDEKYKYIYIEESFKCSDVALEALPQNDNELLSKFASEIIIALDSPKFVPSWFLKKYISNWQSRNQRDYEAAVRCENQNFKAQKARIKSSIDNELAVIDTINPKLKKLKERYNKCVSSEKNKKASKLEIKIKDLEGRIHEIEGNIDKIKESDVKNEGEQTKKLNSYEKSYTAVKNKLCSLFEDITPLSFEIKITDNFTPLKEIQKAQRSKIIGCYIIHNTQNDKYYVGQSKDVLRRLSQHFKNTVPNNPIFAEDYYTTPEDLREDLFEVKIIPLETKDQLDSTERKLIDKYDARLNGYNGTSGNQ